MTLWRNATLAGCAALVVLVAGCGGGSTKPSAATYVHTVCSAMKSFGTDVQRGAQQLQTTVEADASKSTAVKQATATFLRQAKSDSDKVVATLTKLGAPNVSDGDSIHRAVLGAFTDMSSSYGQDAARVSKLNATNRTSFNKQLTDIGTGSQQLGQSLTTRLQGSAGLGSPSLTSARSKDSVCQSLG